VKNIKYLLERVNTIVKNSDNNTLTEIKNISDILEVDGKIATVLHFINKDGDWNPHTITLLEDILKKQKLTEGMDQKKMDFYLLNYLDKHWKDLVIKRLMAAKGLNFVSTWLVPIVNVIVDDVTKLGLYPDIDFKANPEMGKVEYEDYKQLFGDDSMFLYGPLVDWLHDVVKSEEKDGLVVQQNPSEDAKHFFDLTPTGEYDRGEGRY